jgi:transposase InsO family protein
MEQRFEFVLEWAKHESGMAELCRAYEISRKTGYRLLAQYQAEGLDGLKPRSRAARRHPNASAEDVCAAVLRAKAAHPSWGPKKLKPLDDEPETICQRWPVASTRGAILARAGLTVPRRPPRPHVPPRTQPFGSVSQANDTWCADFKGWFRTADGVRCDPLTISDAHSRLLLRCQAMQHGTDGQQVRPLFEATFREYGLPLRLRTDNGTPFATVGAGGLSALSIWWIKLGIIPERIDPGRPSQNGRHERLHRTLQAATAQPPAATIRAQQRCFDAFRLEYNHERPHEALGQQPPSSWYSPSARSYPRRLEAPSYPTADQVRQVRHNGEIRWASGTIYVSNALIGEPVGIYEAADGWLLRYGPIDLGLLDPAQSRLRRPTTRSRGRRSANRRPMAERP